MSAATLLEDGFNQVISYWQINNMGTRAGLIAHLITTIGISQNVAIKWVDAITDKAFKIAISDDDTYGTFKARFIAVGTARSLNAAEVIFESLRKDTLSDDARTELIAKIDENISAIDIKINDTSSSITDLLDDTPSTTRNTSLDALALYLTRLQKQRDAQVRDRDRLAALAG